MDFLVSPMRRGLADETSKANNTTTTTNTTTVSNSTAVLVEAEIEHEYDAVTTLFLNLCLICCLMLAYYVKKFRIYSFPESTGALLVGVIIGGIARFSTENLTLFEFVRKWEWLFSSFVLRICTHNSSFFFLHRVPKSFSLCSYHQSSLKRDIH